LDVHAANRGQYIAKGFLMKKQGRKTKTKRKKVSNNKKSIAINRAKKSSSSKKDKKGSAGGHIAGIVPDSISNTKSEKKVGKGTSVSAPGIIGKFRQFFRESKKELTRVKWPTRKELFASTSVVIVLSLIVAFFLGLVDFGLIKMIKAIIG
jgi:preprotein translocase subunit SecE